MNAAYRKSSVKPPPGGLFLFKPICWGGEGDLFERLIERGKKDSGELVQNIFLKWLLGVNKYCNNNADRVETGRFPIRIEAQCRIFEFCLTLTKNENKLSQIAYNDIKWNENKALQSKKIKSLLEQIGLGELWMKAHYADIGIVNMIRQRLKDIELQRWLSEINNDTRKDANQSNKMRTYRLFKTIDNYKCEDYLHRVTKTRHRIALTKLRLHPQISHRDRMLFETV